MEPFFEFLVLEVEVHLGVEDLRLQRGPFALAAVLAEALFLKLVDLFLFGVSLPHFQELLLQTLNLFVRGLFLLDAVEWVRELKCKAERFFGGVC